MPNMNKSFTHKYPGMFNLPFLKLIFARVWSSFFFLRIRLLSIYYVLVLLVLYLHCCSYSNCDMSLYIELLQSFRRHATHCSHICAIFTRKLANSSPAAVKAGSTYLTYYNFFLCQNNYVVDTSSILHKLLLLHILHSIQYYIYNMYILTYL